VDVQSSITSINRKNIASSDFMIKVERQDIKSWQGTIEHLQSGQVFTIRDLGQMTFLILNKLDSIGLPQPATEIRTWKDKNNASLSSKSNKKIDPKKSNQRIELDSGPTFFIRIYYRQNATWQGSIQWLEKNSTMFFRSYLEMMLLIQEAIEEKGG